MDELASERLHRLGEIEVEMVDEVERSGAE
jgi:hypothetical protein